MSAPVLALESVSKQLWRGPRPIDVLREVSLDLEAGELAAVWGPRGSGKSTLLEVAAGINPPDAGRVLLDGRDLADEPFLAEIGIATREGPSDPDLPIGAWLELALIDRVSSRQARRRAHRILERLGIEDLDGTPWTHLSDGERTLASIAHAVVREPRVLLVDDLTAGLDLLERLEVIAVLRSLADQAGVAVLITASDVGEVQGARPIWAIGGGRLIGGRPKTTGTVVDFPVRDGSGRS